MFTEIDYNYVKEPIIANQEMINKYFEDREKWTSEGIEEVSAYPNHVKIFDEYMTFSILLDNPLFFSTVR